MSWWPFEQYDAFLATKGLIIILLDYAIFVSLTYRHWAPSMVVKHQSSYLVYLNICITYQTCENLNSIGRRSCERIMEEKQYSCRTSCVLQTLEFETSAEISNSLVRNNFFLKKTNVTSEGTVSLMFYTINSSPLLLVTKSKFLS